MKAIVAVDNNYVIGYNGKLLQYIPNDLKRFKEITTGKIVIYGRKTLDTFPNKQPLKNRINIILSKNNKLVIDDAKIINSLADLIKYTYQYNTDNLYVIGGQSIYELLIDYIDTIEITQIYADYKADSYFPDIRLNNKWKLENQSQLYSYEDIMYNFQTWKRNK